eukprot:TRINITY_DN15400_c0_g1_i1.p1 TRINITY_DN15400_c0_g1~~TRINITY_DN15400_c0_g1_i1.p1  ORF type:complete len:300 (+),score=99.13 TRINITY_DN15400_c0_g1_i1:1964-2863(+)
MILLETHNPIIENALNSRIATKGNSKQEPIDITAADFDGVQYHVTSSPDQPNIVQVSVRMECLSELKKHGAEAVIQESYGRLVAATENGFDLTLSVNVDDLPSDTERLVRDIASVKTTLLGAALGVAFDAVDKGQELAQFSINYRPGEALYVIPRKDSVIVIFAIQFRDPTDIAIAKVFLQEFSEARRQGGLGQAPPVSYSVDVPMELKGQGVQEDPNVSFASFVLFPRNWEGAKRALCTSQIQMFRNYLHYHIKCSKAYMHTRMRARVASMLKILRQAMPKDETKEKKTASGRTFTRK